MPKTNPEPPFKIKINTYLRNNPISSELINTAIKACTISASASLATLPFMQMVSNVQVGYNPSPYSFARTMLYTLPMQMISAQKRGVISVVSRHVNDQDNSIFNSPYFMMGIFSQADTLLPAIARNSAKLISANKDPGKLTLHNMGKLLGLGYTVRSTANLLNYAFILNFSEQLSDLLPIDNELQAKFAGGALSGIANAIITHPLAEAHDRLVLQTKIDKQGQLITRSSYSFFKENYYYAKKQGFLNSFKQFSHASKSVLLLIIVMTGLVYSMIEGMNHWLGDTPLNDFLDEYSQINIQPPELK